MSVDPVFFVLGWRTWGRLILQRAARGLTAV